MNLRINKPKPKVVKLKKPTYTVNRYTHMVEADVSNVPLHTSIFNIYGVHVPMLSDKIVDGWHISEVYANMSDSDYNYISYDITIQCVSVKEFTHSQILDVLDKLIQR